MQQVFNQLKLDTQEVLIYVLLQTVTLKSFTEVMAMCFIVTLGAHSLEFSFFAKSKKSSY